MSKTWKMRIEHTKTVIDEENESQSLNRLFGMLTVSVFGSCNLWLVLIKQIPGNIPTVVYSYYKVGHSVGRFFHILSCPSN